MLRDVCAQQAGVVSRKQALAAGLTDETIEARLHAGRWRRLHQGVYATFSGPVPRAAQRWAAVLYAGDGAMVSHRSAAELVGLVDGDVGGHGMQVYVTVPAHRRVTRTDGVVVHRSRRAAAKRHPVRRPPQTRVEETVLDLAHRAATLDEAIGWIARACGKRLTTPARLREALRHRREIRRHPELVAVIGDVAAGCHSLLEVRYLRDVARRHGLPAAVRQQARHRPGGRWYDDVRYRAYRTVVELDGRVAHPDEQRWRDMDRDNAGVAEGLSVLRYGTAPLFEQPCEVAAQVATVLIRNGWPGTPRPCGSGCPVRAIVPPSARS